MAFAAKMVRNIRSSERHPVELDGTLRDEDWRPFDVTVLDLSVDGFRVPAVVALPVGGSITLGLPGIGPRAAVIVRHDADEYGCQFAERLAADELAATLDALPLAPIAFPAAPAPKPAELRLTADAIMPAERRLPFRARLATLVVAAALPWLAIAGWILLR